MVSGGRKGDQVLFPKTLFLGNHICKLECTSIAAVMGSVPQNVLDGAIQLPVLSIYVIKHDLGLRTIIIGSPE